MPLGLIDDFHNEELFFMDKPLCIVAGVGPGNGLAFCKKFLDEGYRVAILARNLERRLFTVECNRRNVFQFISTTQFCMDF
jgi:NAD(P)-dependent dehydrogenase (short-subunit alcohol dehydrogenase family)